MAISIRVAGIADAPRLTELIRLLRHVVDAAGVADRLCAVDSPQLVAEADGQVIGLCGLHAMVAIHRDRPVGRITILVVDEAWRGRGIGRQLVDGAIAHFRDRGCELLEVTSNDSLIEAHAFYRALGFEQTSKRFALRLT